MNKLQVVFTKEMKGKKALLYSPINGAKRDYMLLMNSNARLTRTRQLIEKVRKEILERDNVIIKDTDIMFVHVDMDMSFCKI
ncbi:MAG: hypothetical protein IJX99_01385 [Clostridia bacterium]|nr:hypothetical protein [Clostridia bacterium]